MFSFVAEDVSQALQYGIEHLLHDGIEESTRNGPVIAAPGPVCVEYVNPRRRVLFSPTRDANPVFHLMESLWMLSGSWDIEFPVFFSSNYGSFSDDGKTMWDAYGHRWRHFFGWDQLDEIVEELKNNPTSRRCVLSMWNGMAQSDWKHPLQTEPWSEDFGTATAGGKCVPCNTHTYFAIRAGKLNMTVMNRSNDAIWGAFGANAVHFSFLLEYMAARIGVPMGSYYQFTNNLHIYTEKFSREKLAGTAIECATNLFSIAPDSVAEYPALGPTLTEALDADLTVFMQWALSVMHWEGIGGTKYPADCPITKVPELATDFMSDVAVPMFLFWTYRKWKDEYSSNICLDGIAAPDWKLACQQWKDRRKK